jgi:hypothetical protein
LGRSLTNVVGQRPLSAGEVIDAVRQTIHPILEAVHEFGWHRRP